MPHLTPPLRIATLREARRLTHEQLGLLMINHPDPFHATAAERNAAREEVRQYENAEAVPSWERIVALAQVLGCRDVLELFEPMPVKHWAKLLDQVELENIRAAAPNTTIEDLECRSNLPAHTAAQR